MRGPGPANRARNDGGQHGESCSCAFHSAQAVVRL